MEQQLWNDSSHSVAAVSVPGLWPPKATDSSNVGPAEHRGPKYALIGTGARTHTRARIKEDSSPM